MKELVDCSIRAAMQRSDESEKDPLVHPALVVAIGLALVMVMIVGAGVWQLRRDALEGHERVLTTLASALSDELERGMQGVTVALLATRDELRQGRLDPRVMESAAVLQARANILPLARKLWILDEHGEILAASRLSAAPAADSFMPPLERLSENAVALSTPYIDSESEPVVAMAMRVVGVHGENYGWVMAEMPSRQFIGAFTRIDLGRAVRLEVVRSDGVRLAGGLGKREDGKEPAPVGAVEGLFARGQVRFDDGTERFVQERALQHFPLKLVFTYDTHYALLHWVESARFAGAILVIVLAALTMLLARMLRSERARVQAQRVLRLGRERQALSFAAAQEGNWDWEPGSDEVYLSPRMKEMMGLPRDCGGRAKPGFDADFAGTPLKVWFDALHPEDAQALQLALEGQFGSVCPLIDLQLRAMQADSRCHWIRLRGTAARDETGRTVRIAGVAFDITDERERAAHTQRLEAQLSRTRKLESLGTLAGGVAHDFNNILAAVVGYGEMARLNAPEGSALAHHLEQILHAGLRGKSVVERILTFSRSGTRPQSKFPVQPVVQQVLELLAASMNARIKLERFIEEEQLCVCGDSTQLFEATMNLCTNALLAMPEGGVLGIRLCRHETKTERWLSHGRLQPGEYVELAVIDNGMGIHPTVMEHLFEPFFTTREAGAGTGLGLAVVHSVVEAFGGAIDVVSAPERGSSFTLYFPLASAADEEPLVEPRAIPVGHGQTVLVVDDDTRLVELSEESLAQLGYEPVGFTNAELALSDFRLNPSRYDLVVTDEVMPGMSGTVFARHIHDIRPELPILLVSGYGGPLLIQRAQAAGVYRVLTKPLQREELARAMADALGETLVQTEPTVSTV